MSDLDAIVRTILFGKVFFREFLKLSKGKLCAGEEIKVIEGSVLLAGGESDEKDQ